MANVIINGEVVVPAKKVKMTDHKNVPEIEKIIKDKAKEILDAEQLPNNQGQS
jgi:DNA-directed RNA polymerase subunit H (RpoH/RPB5)